MNLDKTNPQSARVFFLRRLIVFFFSFFFSSIFDVATKKGCCADGELGGLVVSALRPSPFDPDFEVRAQLSTVGA